MIKVKVSSKGQIVVPKEIREKIGLTEGTELAVQVKGKEMTMKRIKRGSWRRWRGSLKGTDVLRDLEKEHREEIGRDAKNN